MMESPSEEEINKLRLEIERLRGEAEGMRKDSQALASAINHDLRAPFRVASSFAQILLQDYNDKLDERGRHIINVIRQSLGQADEMIVALLNIASAGRVEMNIMPIDLKRLFGQVFEELEKEHSERKVLLQIPTHMPAAMADEELLKRAVRELLDNAFKFTINRPDPVIGISAEKIDDYVQVSISDNGVGFDMEYASKLFQPFQRMHTQDQFTGIGAGLALAKKIVNRLGGTIFAEARAGAGATFTFSLPAERH